MPLKIRERERRQASPPGGADMHRQAWTEFQVVDGRKVIGRHDFRHQAEKHIEKIEAERKKEAGQ